MVPHREHLIIAVVIAPRYSHLLEQNRIYREGTKLGSVYSDITVRLVLPLFSSSSSPSSLDISSDFSRCSLHSHWDLSAMRSG